MAISIALIILLGVCGDYLFRQMRLPGLVGMLLVGVIIGPYVLNLMAPEMMTVSGDFRKIALIVILLRAGFELRRDALNRVGRAALFMSAVPAVFEIVGIMLVAPWLLGVTYLEAAVLSILVTAPIGAIGIIVLGERILDREERSSYRFNELRERMGLPRVGERLRNKDSDDVWKVIEEKETWIEAPVTSVEQETGSPSVPAISLRFWKEDSSNGPGTGKTLTCRYSQKDAPFDRHWEILYDW